VAGLWAAVEAAAAGGDVSSPYSRIAGFVFALVPQWGSVRMDAFDTFLEVAEQIYGGIEAAAAENPKDCSLGFGCVSFPKKVAAKGSSAPSLMKIRACKGKLPPVLVLANAASYPGHPVRNGRAVASALGAEFSQVETYDEAAEKWPGLIADFVARVAVKEGIRLSEEYKGGGSDLGGSGGGGSGSFSGTTSKGTPSEAAARVSGSAEGVFSDVADGLTLTREALLRSSKMCIGDPTVYPEMLMACKAYKPSGTTPLVTDADEETRRDFFQETKGWNQAWLDDPANPGIDLYRQTGLSVHECVEAGYIHNL